MGPLRTVRRVRRTVARALRRPPPPRSPATFASSRSSISASARVLRMVTVASSPTYSACPSRSCRASASVGKVHHYAHPRHVSARRAPPPRPPPSRRRSATVTAVDSPAPPARWASTSARNAAALPSRDAAARAASVAGTARPESRRRAATTTPSTSAVSAAAPSIDRPTGRGRGQRPQDSTPSTTLHAVLPPHFFLCGFPIRCNLFNVPTKPLPAPLEVAPQFPGVLTGVAGADAVQPPADEAPEPWG